MSRHLTLVHGFKQLALKERLLKEAVALFPHDEERRKKWADAKLFLATKPIKARIGLQCKRGGGFPRTMREAGIQGGLATGGALESLLNLIRIKGRV